MSATIDIVAGTTGCLGSARNVIYAVNSGYWWVFAWGSTNLVESYYSSDGITWLAGAQHTLSNVHSSEGRNLSVGYKNIAGVDVVHLTFVYQSGGTSLGLRTIRATIAGTVLTFHSTETNLQSPHTDFDSLFWCSSSIELASNSKVHVGCGWAATGDGSMSADDSSVDAGTPEQMTPVTWAGTNIDTSETTEARSFYMFDSGSTTMGYIADNGATVGGTTGLEWSSWNGSTWSNVISNVDVTGSISSIDRNDWGAVARTTTDCHVVYRTALGGWQHRRWNGTSWSNGDSIPAQVCASGTGVALASDGTNVWVSAIASDGANSVVCISWRAAGGWDLAWTVLEASTATRTWISCGRDLVAGKLIIIWHEGTTLKSAYLGGGGGGQVYYYPYWFNAMRIM